VCARDRSIGENRISPFCNATTPDIKFQSRGGLALFKMREVKEQSRVLMLIREGVQEHFHHTNYFHHPLHRE
jgi:hypothetical protein